MDISLEKVMLVYEELLTPVVMCIHDGINAVWFMVLQQKM